MKKTLIAAVLAATTAGAFAAAAPVMNAQPSTPWYVGVGLDYSPVWTDNIGSGAFKLKTRGFGGNVFVGYHVNKYFGTEFGVDIVAPNKYSAGAVSNAVQYKNRWNVHFVGNAYLPVNAWFSPFAFAGVAWMNNRMDVLGVEAEKYSGLALTYGAGLQFNIQEFGIRLKYTRFDDSQNFHLDNVGGAVPVTAGATVNVPQSQDILSLDVLYRFGM